MKLSIKFCYYGISRESAVFTALLRLHSLFKSHGVLATGGLKVDRISLIRKKDISCMRGCDYVVCANIWQIFLVRIILIGSKAKIIYWVQGLVAEESYLKKKSHMRYVMLRALELIAFKLSYAYIYVSQYMKLYYRDRFKFTYKSKYLVLPCISDLVMPTSEKRVPDSYCYLGGMAGWQKFETVVMIMNRVISQNPDASFGVATKEIRVCNDILYKMASPDLLKKTTLCSLSGNSEVAQFLARHEFGFLIRDDVPVNNVSSPIKLAEYLSCGVNPITTNAIKSYAPHIGGAAYLVNIDDVLRSDNKIVFHYKGEAAALSVYMKFFSNDSVDEEFKMFLNLLETNNA